MASDIEALMERIERMEHNLGDRQMERIERMEHNLGDRQNQIESELRIMKEVNKEVKVKQKDYENDMKMMFNWIQEQNQQRTVAEEELKRKEEIIGGAMEQASVEVAGMKRGEFEIKEEQKEEEQEISNIQQNVQEIAQHMIQKETQAGGNKKDNQKIDNMKRQTIIKNLSDIILDPNDIALVGCSKPYADANLKRAPETIIKEITYPETVEIIEILQTDLFNRKVRYNEWNLHLMANCSSIAKLFCLNDRKQIKPWQEIIIDMFSTENFEQINTSRLQKIMNTTNSEDQYLLKYLTNIINEMRLIKGIQTIPMLLTKLRTELQRSDIHLALPESYQFNNTQEIKLYLNKHISPLKIIPAKTEVNKLFHTHIQYRQNKQNVSDQFYRDKKKQVTPKIGKEYYYCKYCTCKKCKQFKYNRNGKPGFCFDCQCQNCRKTTANYKTKEDKYNINKRDIKVNLLDNYPYDTGYSSNEMESEDDNENYSNDPSTRPNSKEIEQMQKEHSGEAINEEQTNLFNASICPDEKVYNDDQIDIILDTGADTNFTYGNLWKYRTEINLREIVIRKEFQRNCHPISVTPAFGKKQTVTKQLLLNITFKNHQIKEWFYVLESEKQKVLLGKPLLKKLNYTLSPKEEYIRIRNDKINIEGIKGACSRHEILTIEKNPVLATIKKEFPDIFSEEIRITPLHNYTVKVSLNNFPYAKSKAFFVNGDQQEAIRIFVQQSLEMGIIETIDSDELVALSPVFPIKQKSGKFRVVTDLRKVNQYLQFTPRPIPPTASILPGLAQKRIFSVIDIRKAYQQIPMKGDKLGLITQFGSFKFTRLPYGLVSAPYWWGEFISKIISTITTPSESVIRYYYDDIIIASQEENEHIEIVRQTFQALKKNGLTVSEEKVQIAQPIIQFLGYEISYNRIHIDQDKRDTITNWELPSSKEGILKFTGFVNFLRHFVPDTSKLLKPFYEMAKLTPNELQSNEQIKQKAKTNFAIIKRWIEKSLYLKLFDPTEPTIIYTDASKEGASSIVFQPEVKEQRTKLLPIAFYSVCFNETQQRYATVERELWAVIHTLEKARLQISSDVTIYTDNQGIISMGKSDRSVHPRLMKYLDVLSGYRLTWRYLPGIRNVLADYLSRFGLHKQPTLNFDEWRQKATEITVDINATQFEEEKDDPEDRTSEDESVNQDTQEKESIPLITPMRENEPSLPQEDNPPNDNVDLPPIPIESTANQPNNEAGHAHKEHVITKPENLTWNEILQIKKIISEREEVPQKYDEVIDSFKCIQGILHIIRENTLLKVITDADYMNLADKLHHKFHCTHRVLQQMITEENCWNPNGSLLNLDIIRNCRECEVYQKFNELPIELPPIKNVPVFHRWHLDYIGPLPIDGKEKNQFILIAVDYASNLVIVEPEPHQSNLGVFKMILKIMSLFGIPKEVVTDNGSPFIADVLPIVATQLRIKYIQTSAYNPRANSKAERTIRMLKSVLKHMADRGLKHWATFIYGAAKVVNSTRLIYGYAPCEIAYATAPTINGEYSKGLSEQFDTANNSLQIQELEAAHLAIHRKRKINTIRQETNENKQKVREALKRTRNEKDAHITFTKGEYVYRWRPKTNKHEPTWDGPYAVKDVLGENTYRLQDLNGFTRKALYNGTKLKPAYSYYGSPIRSAAEYTRVYNDKERRYYIHTLQDILQTLQD